MSLKDDSAAYRSLTETVAFADLSGRSQIQMTGSERAAFLQKFCTNDISRLTPLAGCEAFIPNVQGKVLGYVEVFNFEDHLLLLSAPGQSDSILNHLRKYVLRSDVQFHDVTNNRRLVLVGGQQAQSTLEGLLACDLSSEVPFCRLVPFGQQRIFVCTSRYLHPRAYWLAIDDAGALMQILVDQMGSDVGFEVADTMRVESGTAE